MTVITLLMVVVLSEGRDVGPDSVEALAARLRDSDAKVREEAATGLRRLGPKAAAAVPTLVALLGDSGRPARIHAANCLGFIGPQAKPAIPVLAHLLENKAETDWVRFYAAEALGRIGPDALDVLVESLRFGADTVAQGKAAHAIGLMGPKAEPAVPHLIAALAEEDESLWSGAVDSLIAIGPASVPPLRAAITSPNARIRARAARALLALDPGRLPTIRAMIRELKNPDSAVREDVVLALELAGRNAAEETVPALADALKDDHAVVREIAARHLTKIGPEARPAIPGLIKAMHDPEFEVRGYSALALGNIGVASREVVTALTRGMDDEEGDVRILVARALGTLGPAAASAVPKLRAVLDEPGLDGLLRQTVQESLSKIVR